VANLRGKSMVLGLKIEEELTVVNNEPIVEQEKITDEELVIVTDEVNITVETETNVNTNLDNTFESRAAKRAERLAQFHADSVRKEKQLAENEIRLKLKLLSEEQKNAFLKEKEEQEHKENLKKAKEIFRQKRSAIYEEIQLTKQQQIENGLEYQKNLLLSRAEREEKARIQKEAELAAAESLKLAEEAKIAADIINAEAERFAEEARRRLAFAESKAKENNKKQLKSINAPDESI